MYRGPYPSLSRTVWGFAIAPMAGAFPLILLTEPGRLPGLFLMMAYASALLFSLPLFLWLRHRKVAPTLLNCVLAGAGSAMLPWLLSGFFLAGFVILASFIAAPLGALGGVFFWLIACRGTPGMPFVAVDVE